MAWGDIDNDGDLDLVAIGDCGINCRSSKIYVNNGTSLVESSQWGQNLSAVLYGSLSFADIDNDGDLDLSLSGCSGEADFVDSCDSETERTITYLNNGTSLVESSQWGQNLSAVYKSALAWGDIDNDGDLDLGLCGQTGAGKISKIYLNNGTSLVESSQWQSNLTGIEKCSLALGDIDNDGDLDLIISGRDISSNKLTKTYLSNGTSLVESSQWGSSLVSVEDSSLAFADIDNDGDLDLSLTGCCDKHRLYKNNGSTFIEISREITGGLTGVFAGSQAFGDYDSDGYLDLIANGREEKTTLYLYNVSGLNFTANIQDPESDINDLYYSSVAWLDLEGDTDLDLIETGYGDYQINSYVYISNASLTRNNTKPNSPNSSLSSGYVNNILTLSWGNGSDAETNSSGLYYNLMVGNSTTNNSIVSGIYGGSSNPTAGYFGNMMQRRSIALNLQLDANTTYYWYVQTIDTGLAKSNWSVQQNFTTSLDITKPNITLNYPSPNSSLHTTNPYFIFNATVTDANLTNVTLNANWNGSWSINQSNSSGVNGTYTFTANLTSYNDGHYSWYIGANDSSNNSETATRDFYLDRAYPLVYLISPVNSGSWTSSSSVTFSFNVTDTDIANCSLIIDNAVVNTSSSITEDTTQTFTKTMSNSAYTWSVNCTDYVNYVNSSSTYSLTVSYTAPVASTSSGGGGGGTVSTAKNYALTNEQLNKGYTQNLAVNDKIGFLINNENHSLTLHNLNSSLNYVNLTLNSNLISFIIYINETKRFNLTSSQYYDLLIRLNNINGNKANLTIKNIYEEMPISKEEQKEIEKKEKQEEKEQTEKDMKFVLIIIGIAILALIIILWNTHIYYFNNLKKHIKHKRLRKYIT